MQDPRESMRQLAEQMGWLTQMMGGDFWDQVQATMEAARPQGAGTGANIRQGPGPMPVPPRPPHAAGSPTPTVFPPLEIYVTPLEVVLCAALPGVAPEAVAISLTAPNELILEAFIQPGGLGAPLLRERPAGYVTRAVTLPVPIQPQNVVGRYADGVVEFRFPRLEPGAATNAVSLLHVSPAPTG